MGQEILPPRRNPVARAEPARVTAQVPGVNKGGIIASYLATRHHERNARAINAETLHTTAEVGLFNARANVIDAEIKVKEKLFVLQELPERLGHELALRRVARVESFSQAVHDHKQNELRREMEETYSHADLTRARTVLVDAEQQLKAQQDHGYLNHDLNQRKKALEIMDVQLDAEERKALLKERLNAQTVPGNGHADAGPADADIDEALQFFRQHLNARGLDPSKIEAVIASRRQK